MRKRPASRLVAAVSFALVLASACNAFSPAQGERPSPSNVPAAPLVTPDVAAILRRHYDAITGKDVTAAAAVFTSDAEVSMPWLIGTTCCKGQSQIQSGLRNTLNGYAAAFTLLEIAQTGAASVTARVEAKTKLTQDVRLGRAILAVSGHFLVDKIDRLDQVFDTSDPVTERAVRQKRLLETDAGATLAPLARPPVQPALREVAAPPNVNIANATWVQVDAPGGARLLAAYRKPPGTGPFPVVVGLHPGGGFTSGAVNSYLNARGFAEAGFIVLAGCWYDGDNPLNPPSADLIACPNAPPYQTSYRNRLPAAHALVESARILPGADPDRIGLYGESQGAGAVVLLGSTGARVRAIVANSAPYTRGFSSKDTPPIAVVADLAAPLLILHGLVDDPAGRALPEEAKAYEAELKRLGKPYEAMYYPGVAHEDLNTNPVSKDDYKTRTLAFFRRWLSG